jgi:tetratricopeptide (TPR) repeat protein
MRNFRSSTAFRSQVGGEWGKYAPTKSCLILTTVDRKSQIAIEYAYRFKEKYPQKHVFWVFAANRSRFQQAYQDIAERLRLPGYDDPAADVCKLVLRWLAEEDTQWLMIIDNADDPELFFPPESAEPASGDPSLSEYPLIKYLPTRLSASKLLLITTRSEKVGDILSHGEQCIEVPPFNYEEALLLLQHRSKDAAAIDQSPESAKLLQILEYIPLAITQAAAFIRRNRTSLQDYLTALEKDDQNLKDYLSAEQSDDRRDGDHPSAVFRTWKLSFDQIRKQEPLSAEVLSLMALFDRRDIPQSLMKSPQDSDVDFKKAIGTLKAFNLIVQEADSTTLSMHPLVQYSIQVWLEHNGKKIEYEEQALQRLESEFPYPEHETREICGRLYPHAQVVLGYKTASESSRKVRGELFRVIGWYDMNQGNYRVAEKNVLEALHLLEVVAKNSPGELDCRRLLGHILVDQGKYEKAEQMLKENLKAETTLLRKNHPDTLSTMQELARALHLQGKYSEAEELSRKTLKLKEVELGEGHSTTLATMNDLALVLIDQQKYEEAKEIIQRVLKSLETVLGKEHPDTLTSMHNLASAISSQQKHEEAEEMFQEVLTLSEKVLGKEHPNTLRSMNCLALVLSGQQKYEEAEEMFREVLKLREMVLRKEHPDTLTSMHDLAIARSSQQKYEEAEEMFQEVLTLRETVLGKENSGTLMTVWHFACLYRNQQRLEEAEPIYQRASAGFQKVLGPDHPWALRCVEEHEDLLKKLGIAPPRTGNLSRTQIWKEKGRRLAHHRHNPMVRLGAALSRRRNKEVLEETRGESAGNVVITSPRGFRSDEAEDSDPEWDEIING